jgi:hypothetical protein
MSRFLSASWAAEFNAALEGVELPGPDPDGGLAAADGRFTVVQEVEGSPDGDTRLILRVEDRSLVLAVEPSGPSDPSAGGGAEVPADVTIRLSYQDAAALSRGELVPADALNRGRIRVRGDLSVLVAAQRMLAAARAATGDLTASTTY